MIEFVKDWQAYRKGATTDALPGGVVDALRCRGIVRDAAQADAAPTAGKLKQPPRTRSR